MADVRAWDDLPPIEEAVEEMLAEVRAYKAAPHYAQVVAEHTPAAAGVVPPPAPTSHPDSF